jgi:hypothetical protein
MDLRRAVQNGADEKNVKKMFHVASLDLKMTKDDSNLGGKANRR